MTIHLTPAQRQRMDKLADAIGAVTDADREFFEQNPDRQHRVRLASPAELEEYEIVQGARPVLPPGFWAYVAGRNVAPGIRIRVRVSIHRTRVEDAEAFAAGVFEFASSPQTRSHEAMLRRAAEARP